MEVVVVLLGRRGRESESVTNGSGSEAVRTGVRFGVRLGRVIEGTARTLVVVGVGGVVFSGATPF